MGGAADMMTRPLFMAIMVTSWMCIQGQDDCSDWRVTVNCSYMTHGKSVNCTVDYSDVGEPAKCWVTESYLCDIDEKCSIGTARERLSFVVRNVEEGEYKVFVRTTCGESCTSVHITLDPAHSPQESPASLSTLWGGAGVVAVAVALAVVVAVAVAVAVAAFIIFGILKHKRYCSRVLNTEKQSLENLINFNALYPTLTKTDHWTLA